MLVIEDRTDEGQELFVGIGFGEFGSPTLVEFHKTRCSVVYLRATVIVSMPLLIVNFPKVVSLIINE